MTRPGPGNAPTPPMLERVLLRIRGEVLGGATHAWLSHGTPRIQRINSSSLLVIAPHPDDETLGCGGLIALKRASGARVGIVVVTDGSQSHPNHPVLGRDRLVATRRSEVLKAVLQLGVPSDDVRFLDQPDGALSDLPPTGRERLVQVLEAEIRARQPAAIAVPFRHDVHGDHEAAYAATREAVSRLAMPIPIIEYPLWSLWHVRAPVWALWRQVRIHRLDISAVLDRKRSAVGCFATQISPVAPWTGGNLPRSFVRRNLSCWELFGTGKEHLTEL